jgi:hypothetical protein
MIPPADGRTDPPPAPGPPARRGLRGHDGDGLISDDAPAVAR